MSPWVKEIHDSDVRKAESVNYLVQLGDDFLYVDNCCIFVKDDAEDLLKDCLKGIKECWHSRQTDLEQRALFLTTNVRVVPFRLQ